MIVKNIKKCQKREKNERFCKNKNAGRVKTLSAFIIWRMGNFLNLIFRFNTL